MFCKGCLCVSVRLWAEYMPHVMNKMAAEGRQYKGSPEERTPEGVREQASLLWPGSVCTEGQRGLWRGDG